MGCICNKKCANKEITSWNLLEDYIQGGKSIWLTIEETIKLLKIYQPGSGFKYEFDPFSGTMKIEYKYIELDFYYTRWSDIPYIDYHLPEKNNVPGIIPPGLRIARQDLWSSKIFKSWLKSKEELKIKRDKIFGNDVSKIVGGYLKL